MTQIERNITKVEELSHIVYSLIAYMKIPAIMPGDKYRIATGILELQEEYPDLLKGADRGNLDMCLVIGWDALGNLVWGDVEGDFIDEGGDPNHSTIHVYIMPAEVAERIRQENETKYSPEKVERLKQASRRLEELVKFTEIEEFIIRAIIAGRQAA